LVDADKLRAAKILNRSLFEYHLRLRIYQGDASEALRDATEAPKELRRFLETKPVSDVAKFDISADELIQFEAFIVKNQGKPRSRNVWQDVKAVNPGDEAQAFFEYFNSASTFLRSRIERLHASLFAELKDIIKLRRFRLRRLRNVKEQTKASLI
jgi:hypothetical protein